MIRPVLFVAIGAVAAAAVLSWRSSAPRDRVPDEPGAARAPFASAATLSSAGSNAPGAYQADIERRLKRLEAALAHAATDRQRLAEQVQAITAQLAARGRGSEATLTAHAASSSPPLAAEAPVNAASAAPAVHDGMSTMERALTAAGLDLTTAADIKRRDDELAMAEIYLRDQATREQWLDTPRFAAEMAAIDAQRTPLRTEIGDDAYDRYLFAQGQTNRVRVEDVMQESPAAEAGLQAGDLILRYGDTRLFGPGELVKETRSGTAGEAVQLEVVRNGQRFAVEVPRGPLGLRVAAAQGTPDAS